MRTFASHASRLARPATTLVEMIIVVALIALVSGFLLPPMKRGFDRIQTRGAAHAVMTFFFSARAEAIARGQRVAVTFDGKGGRVFVVSGRDTLMMRRVGTEYGVTMTASRDSMTFYPDGLGLGGANLSVIVRHGSAADTVIASREGRVKLGARAR